MCYSGVINSFIMYYIYESFLVILLPLYDNTLRVQKIKLAGMHANDSLKVTSTQCSIRVFYLEVCLMSYVAASLRKETKEHMLTQRLGSKACKLCLYEMNASKPGTSKLPALRGADKNLFQERSLNTA